MKFKQWLDKVRSGDIIRNDNKDDVAAKQVGNGNGLITESCPAQPEKNDTDKQKMMENMARLWLEQEVC